MANSLQDQLLKAGVINKQKANQVKAEKRKKSKQKRQTKTTAIDAEQIAIQKAKTEKTQKDKQLNLQKQQSLQSKAIDAQIQQLIDTHVLPSQDDQNDDMAYYFQDGNTVKTIYVNQLLRTKLSEGKIAIVKFNNQYVIVPAPIAEKIRELNNTLLIVINQPEKNEVDYDGYEGYEVPSDLIW